MNLGIFVPQTIPFGHKPNIQKDRSIKPLTPNFAKPLLAVVFY